MTEESFTHAERQLLQSVANGGGVDVRTGDPEVDDPANAAQWDEERTVRGEFLADVLTRTQTTESGQLVGMYLCGARITGQFDIGSHMISCPIMLRSCSFDEPIRLDGAEVPSLDLRECRLPGIHADQLHVTRSVDLYGVIVDGAINLLGADIGGRLVLNKAELTNEDDWALFAAHLTVKQGMSCTTGFNALGGILLSGSHIGGELMFLDATLSNNNGPALFAYGLSVDDFMVCTRITAVGEICLAGAHIGGSLMFREARLFNGNGVVLNAGQVTTGEVMSLGPGVEAQGVTYMAGAHVGSELSFIGATLTSKSGRALIADGITVGQDMLFDEGFTANGEVELSGANINGHLKARKATLTREGGVAFDATKATVNKNVSFGEGFTVMGETRFVYAHVGGGLFFNGASLRNKEGVALNSFRIAVDEDMACNDGFTVEGEIGMVGARIGGALIMTGADLANANKPALDLSHASIDALSLPVNRPDGWIHLTNALVRTFTDDEDGWPDILDLHGFSYDKIEGVYTSPRDRLRWLRLDPRFTPQIYEQLANVYRNAGDMAAARIISVAKEWRRRKPYNPLSWLWYATVGYGYRTGLAVVWVVALTAVGSMVFRGAYPAHMVALTAHPPRFQPVIYTLDLQLPLVGLGQKGAWRPGTSALQNWAWVLTFAGWVLSAAVVAGLTGILKRDK